MHTAQTQLSTEIFLFFSSAALVALSCSAAENPILFSAIYIYLP